MKNEMNLKNEIKRLISFKKQLYQFADMIDIFLWNKADGECSEEELDDISEVISEIKESITMNATV